MKNSNFEIFRIVVTSDTHGNIANLEKLILQNQSANMLIHLGDGEAEFFKMKHQFNHLNMIMVKGNCDLNLCEMLPETKLIQISESIKIFACHGHTLGVKQNLNELTKAAKQTNSTIALFGHTHNRFFKTENNLTFLNPGSLSKPRLFNPSFATISVFNQNKFNIQIHEFKPKANQGACFYYDNK